MSGKKGRSGRRPARVLSMPIPTPTVPLEPEPVPFELKDQHARREWQRIAPGLIASGQVTGADRTLLVGFCLKVGTWLRLEEEVLRRPMAEDAAATIKVIRMANQTLELVMRAAAELGISPLTRSRVVRVPPAAPSKWSDLLP
jgi:P27 family predicted phage terminase small subunit